ncbi:hypothetical protein MRX96_026889 [Rhipicephalus microplus]
MEGARRRRVSFRARKRDAPTPARCLGELAERTQRARSENARVGGAGQTGDSARSSGSPAAALITITAPPKRASHPGECRRKRARSAEQNIKKSTGGKNKKSEARADERRTQHPARRRDSREQRRPATRKQEKEQQNERRGAERRPHRVPAKPDNPEKRASSAGARAPAYKQPSLRPPTNPPSSLPQLRSAARYSPLPPARATAPPKERAAPRRPKIKTVRPPLLHPPPPLTAPPPLAPAQSANAK